MAIIENRRLRNFIERRIRAEGDIMVKGYTVRRTEGNKLYTQIEVEAHDGHEMDDSELWKVLRQEAQEARARRLERVTPEVIQALQTIVGPIQQHTEYHFSMKLNKERVDWWPSTETFRHNNRNHRGGLEQFTNYLKKRVLPNV